MTAIKHTTEQRDHETRTREVDEAAQAQRKAWADAEVTSWPPPKSYAPKPAPAQAENVQRVPVSFQPSNADEMWRYAQMLARSKLLPRAFYDRDDKEKAHANVADVHFILMKGESLKLHPQVAIGNINVIEGKAEIGASLMVGLCMRSGMCEYFELVESDERHATYVTRRVGGRREISFSYTIEEADQMGLLDKGRTEWAKENNQWKKQPRTMLRRRCQSMLCREVYPDICMGLYDFDELAEMRARELAIGVDPDKVIDGQVQNGGLALEPGQGPGVIARMGQQQDSRIVDPIKARIHQLRKTESAEPVHIGVRKCSLCSAVLDHRDDDPCIACR